MAPGICRRVAGPRYPSPEHGAPDLYDDDAGHPHSGTTPGYVNNCGSGLPTLSPGAVSPAPGVRTSSGHYCLRRSDPAHSRDRCRHPGGHRAGQVVVTAESHRPRRRIARHFAASAIRADQWFSGVEIERADSGLELILAYQGSLQSWAARQNGPSTPRRCRSRPVRAVSPAAPQVRSGAAVRAHAAWPR